MNEFCCNWGLQGYRFHHFCQIKQNKNSPRLKLAILFKWSLECTKSYFRSFSPFYSKEKKPFSQFIAEVFIIIAETEGRKFLIQR